MTKRSELGAEGEEFAAEYLAAKKYNILERNVRHSWGELDIVALANDKTLVFVEVKTMIDGGEEYLKPEDQMSKAKLLKFRKAAMLYAGHNQKLVNDTKGWRLDVVTLVKRGDAFELKHYENI